MLRYTTEPNPAYRHFPQGYPEKGLINACHTIFSPVRRWGISIFFTFACLFRQAGGVFFIIDGCVVAYRPFFGYVVHKDIAFNSFIIIDFISYGHSVFFKGSIKLNILIDSHLL